MGDCITIHLLIVSSIVCVGVGRSYVVLNDDQSRSPISVSNVGVCIASLLTSTPQYPEGYPIYVFYGYCFIILPPLLFIFIHRILVWFTLSCYCCT